MMAIDWHSYTMSTTVRADCDWYKVAEMIQAKQHELRKKMIHWWEMEEWVDYNRRLREYFRWIG